MVPGFWHLTFLVMIFPLSAHHEFDFGEMNIHEIFFHELLSKSGTNTEMTTGLPQHRNRHLSVEEQICMIESDHAFNESLSIACSIFNIVQNVRINTSLILDYDLIINGYNGSSMIGTIGMNDSCFKVIQGANVIINSLTIAKCGGLYTQSVNGGAISIIDSSLTLNNCKMASNVAMLGGAIFASMSIININNCIISNNHATVVGGGVFIMNSFISLHSSELYQNEVGGDDIASTFGGGFGCYVCEGSIEDSLIYDNRIENGIGGGMFLSFANLEISMCSLHNNMAVKTAAAAGAIGIQLDSIVLIKATNISNNQGGSGGGGMVVMGSKNSVILEDCIIASNSAVAGGGLLIISGQYSIQNCLFINNTAKSVYSFSLLSNNSNCRAEYGCITSGNYPNEYNSNEQCTFIAHNNGTLHLIEFFIEPSDFLTINNEKYTGFIGPNCLNVSENTLIEWESNEYGEYVGFEICYREAASNGGAIHVHGGDLSISNSKFRNNWSNKVGSQLYIITGNIDASNIDFKSDESVNPFLSNDVIHFVSGSFDASDLRLNGYNITGDSALAAKCNSLCDAGYYGRCTKAGGVGGACFVDCKCTACVAGRYSTVAGATSEDVCLACPSTPTSSSTSYRGSTECNLASPGFYYKNSTVSVILPCPKDASCNVGLKQQPKPNPGYWVDKSHAQYSDDILKCERETCLVPSSTSNTLDHCWELSNYVYSVNDDEIDNECDPNGLLCSKGSGGPLCGSCLEHYAYSNTHKTCLLCSKYALIEDLDLIVLSCFGIVFVCFLLYLQHRTPVEVDVELNFKEQVFDWLFNKAVGMLESGNSTGVIRVLVILLKFLSFHLLLDYDINFRYSFEIWFFFYYYYYFCFLNYLNQWANYQIIRAIPWILGVEFPVLFNSFLGFLDILAFDVFSIGCLENSFELSVILFSLLPIIITLIIYLVYRFRLFNLQHSMIHKTIQNDDDERYSKNTNSVTNGRGFEEEEGGDGGGNIDTIHESKDLIFYRQQQIRGEHISVVLFTFFVFLPLITRNQLQSLVCVRIHHVNYVRLDTSIECDSNRFLLFSIFDILLCTIFLSIPFCFGILLCHFRHILNPLTADRKLAYFLRDNNMDVHPFRFLFAIYKPELYFFEVIDLYRRIFFIGVLPLVASRSDRKACLGLFLGICSLELFRNTEPFQRRSTNLIAYISQHGIIITFATGLMIDVEVFKGLSKAFLGLILLFVNLFVIGISMITSFLRYKKEKNEKRAAFQLKIRKVEWACNFTVEKFSTTFDAYTKNSTPQLSCLGYFYSTLLHAENALKTGVALSKLHHHHYHPQKSKSQSFRSAGEKDLMAANKRTSSPMMDNLTSFVNTPRGIRDESGEDAYGLVVSLHSPAEFDDVDEQFFPNKEALVACVIARRFLSPLPFPNQRGLSRNDVDKVGSRETNREIKSFRRKHQAIRYIPGHVLQAIRGSFFGGIASPDLWYRGHVFLPPKAVCRAFQLTTIDKQSTFDPKPSHLHHGFKDHTVKKSTLISVGTLMDYSSKMVKFRAYCDKKQWVPLYHYSQPLFADSIAKNGLRMSTQGQGDGGVYFSTLGPASYDVGSDQYEENIIIDCFGQGRLEEYRGKQLLDLVIVYGVEPRLLSPAPGGRDNAVMVTKADFESLAYPHPDGNYFLRPDRILGMFLIQTCFDHLTIGHPPSFNDDDINNDQKKIENNDIQSLKYKTFIEQEKLNDYNIKKEILKIRNQMNEFDNEIKKLSEKKIKTFARRASRKRNKMLLSTFSRSNSTSLMKHEEEDEEESMRINQNVYRADDTSSDVNSDESDEVLLETMSSENGSQIEEEIEFVNDIDMHLQEELSGNLVISPQEVHESAMFSIFM